MYSRSARFGSLVKSKSSEYKNQAVYYLSFLLNIDTPRTNPLSCFTAEKSTQGKSILCTEAKHKPLYKTHDRIQHLLSVMVDRPLSVSSAFRSRAIIYHQTKASSSLQRKQEQIYNIKDPKSLTRILSKSLLLYVSFPHWYNFLFLAKCISKNFNSLICHEVDIIFGAPIFRLWSSIIFEGSIPMLKKILGNIYSRDSWARSAWFSSRIE